METTDQGNVEGDTQRRLEDLPRSRLDSALGMIGRPGVHPESSVLGECGLAQVLFLRHLGSKRLVETRRLELLTLSLQRRRSAN